MATLQVLLLSFQNSLTGDDPTSTATSSFQNSQTGDDPTSTTTSSFQNSLTGSDPTSSFHGSLTYSSSNSTAVDLTSTVGLVSMNDIGLSEGDTQKTNRERAKVYCSHCETSISKSAWYLHYSKFYCHSTKKWKKEERPKPQPFNFDDSSNECPEMEESGGQVGYEQQHLDEFDESVSEDMLPPDSQVSRYIANV